MKHARSIIVFLLAAGFLAGGHTCHARTVLRNICRVKGQEENVIRGVGLVIGLAGTGEANDGPTMRSLARSMELMGAPIPEDMTKPGGGLKELEKIKNVAFVMVDARVPATGARRGDKLDCNVMGVNGKSLAGGRLAFAALQGPNTLDRRVYALCNGAIHLENPAQPMVGVVAGGCQMEEDVVTPFVQDGRITLILDRHHANFQTASEVADSIRRFHTTEGDDVVRAVNASNIVVRVPKNYESNPVEFAADVLETEIYMAEPEGRVVINGRTGLIVISGDVTIGDVVVSYNNVVVEAGAPSSVTAFDTDKSEETKLNALVDALNSIKVPNEDRVEIIKEIARCGKLHGQLIVD